MTQEEQNSNLKNETDNSELGAVSDSFFDEEGWNALGEDEGGGSYCCGKRMVLAPSEIVYQCLKCGVWEYSSS